MDTIVPAIVFTVFGLPLLLLVLFVVVSVVIAFPIVLIFPLFFVVMKVVK